MKKILILSGIFLFFFLTSCAPMLRIKNSNETWGPTLLGYNSFIVTFDDTEYDLYSLGYDDSSVYKPVKAGTQHEVALKASMMDHYPLREDKILNLEMKAGKKYVMVVFASTYVVKEDK